MLEFTNESRVSWAFLFFSVKLRLLLTFIVRRRTNGRNKPLDADAFVTQDKHGAEYWRQSREHFSTCCHRDRPTRARVRHVMSTRYNSLYKCHIMCVFKFKWKAARSTIFISSIFLCSVAACTLLDQLHVHYFRCGTLCASGQGTSRGWRGWEKNRHNIYIFVDRLWCRKLRWNQRQYPFLELLKIIRDVAFPNWPAGVELDAFNCTVKRSLLRLASD